MIPLLSSKLRSHASGKFNMPSPLPPDAWRRPYLSCQVLLHPQVLSDPARRLVYDVYGREGLAAGLQVSKLEG